MLCRALAMFDALVYAEDARRAAFKGVWGFNSRLDGVVRLNGSPR